ncbi:hypothetical protein D3C76_1797980 [compost metagenome]|jgi:hypothetical protein
MGHLPGAAVGLHAIVIIEAGAGSFLINIKAPRRHLAPGSAERCSIAMGGVKRAGLFRQALIQRLSR